VGGRGPNNHTPGRFFDELGAQRARRLTHVSRDGAECLYAVVAERAPGAVICLEPVYAEVRIMPR
jgi:transposase